MQKNRSILTRIGYLLLPEKTGSWRVVALCIVGATIFWFFNALNKDYTTNINYPIVFSYDSDEFIPVQTLPDEIQINVSGGGWNLLRRTNWFNITPLSLPLDDPTELRQLAGSALRGTISDQLPDFKLNFVVTDSLYLNMERLITRKLPVVVDSANVGLRENYRIVSPVLASLDSISFTGPESHINAMPDSFLLPVPNRNVDEDFRNNVNIDVVSSPLIIPAPSSVNVQFQVAEFILATHDFRVALENFPEDSSAYIADPWVSLSYMTRRDQSGVVDSSQFRVVADLNRIVLSDSTIQPIIREYPAGIYDIHIESNRVKVIYEQ